VSQKRQQVAAFFVVYTGLIQFHMSVFDTSLESFKQDVLEASVERPILVDFWADWCSPCLVIAPLLEQVLFDLKGAVGLAKLEVDLGENMKLAGHYRVRGFPTVILFNDGQELGRFSGARSRPQIISFIKDHVDLAGAS
jgi:thioredoxin 1